LVGALFPVASEELMGGFHLYRKSEWEEKEEGNKETSCAKKYL
jgi:hypothetical protein